MVQMGREAPRRPAVEEMQGGNRDVVTAYRRVDDAGDVSLELRSQE